MTHRFLGPAAPFLLALAVATPAAAGTKVVSTWTAPEVAPATYVKVVVYAKFEDDLARRVLEDRVVAGLEDRDIGAIPTYSTFQETDLADEAAVRKKIEELGIDAAIVFTPTGEQVEVKSGPNVHASVGVPVRVGPFSMFVGTSVPLGGGPKTVKQVGVKAEFYAIDVEGPLWIASFSTDLAGGTERAAGEIATQLLKRLKKSGLFE